MTNILAQRRSWATGELLLKYPRMTRETAEQIVRLAEVEAALATCEHEATRVHGDSVVCTRCGVDV